MIAQRLRAKLQLAKHFNLLTKPCYNFSKLIGMTTITLLYHVNIIVILFADNYKCTCMRSYTNKSKTYEVHLVFQYRLYYQFLLLVLLIQYHLLLFWYKIMCE